MSISTTAIRWTLTLLVAVAAIGPIGSTAFAEPVRDGNKAIERAYAATRASLASTHARIEKATARAGKVAEWIGKAKAKGKNTAAVETALASFRSATDTARGTWREAEAILKTHSGFNNDGKVTDPGAAKATVESAAAKLKQTNATLREAYGALRKAINEWRRNNRETPDPKVPEQE